jgi:hypothetical protein
VWQFKVIAVKIYMLPLQVSILRSQLNSKNVEVEMERLTRAQELETQAQEHRDKLKELQKELVHTKTQLEFKVSIMSHLIIWSCISEPPLAPCERERQSERCLQIAASASTTVVRHQCRAQHT